MPRLVSFPDNVLDPEPVAPDPRSGVGRGDDDDGEGDEADDGADDEERDGDPLPVTLARRRRDQLLEIGNEIVGISNCLYS